ncbi:acyl-CoA dehydrogenase family protein [Paracraurococcus ruber]|uniref:Pimeloyl-CoA dehydrogenase small subunit n=1 Tax=Paracraurococcus ruber TaxID=77675 RepID=A0ABS1CZK4_9PROT|nr:acyl-CoA dehydrogenase family protein [Paracraurococcus ruber]MBK1659765.1 pimeloyl-CoA dehydrogenase small subunit [Paracraurococcus ruber]TDG33061.1 pimeloyl-CoA dehydrogenase small subunit [Paracraurococcus ruber]
MDFDLTDDQRLLTDSVARLLSDSYSFEQRKALLKTEQGWSETLWQKYAELGLTGLPIAEEHGGFGGGAVDVMLLMQAFGRHLVLEPYLATVVLGGTALRLAGDAAQQGEILPEVAAGSLRLAFAHYERQARYDITDVLTTAKPQGGGFLLEGAKSVVLHGATADKLVVSARTGGSRAEAEGLSLFLVDADAPGLARRGYRLRDGTEAAELSLSAVQVPREALLGLQDAALPVIQRVVEAGIAATAAEVIGAMETMHAMTLDYLKTRVQFGKPIGENQALQHRAAEMLVAMEQGRSMAMLATMSLEEEDAAERARHISMAKVGVGQAGRFVSQQAVQLHGGIGMTEEYAVGHFFRRVMVIEHLFGDTATHLDRLAEQVA